MQVHSFKITIQDVPDKKGKLYAACFSTVVLDTGEKKMNEDGTVYLDEEKQEVPILEDIQTIFPLNMNPQFKSNIQAIIVEALTLKNLEIAKENGDISHFVESVGGGAVGGKKKGKKDTKPKKRK